MDDETQAKLDLLKGEIDLLQQGIRSSDGVLYQIKGWCVTVTIAIGGFAISSSKPALVLVGLGAVVGFWLADAHYKSTQRVLIERANQIESAIAAANGPIAALTSGAIIVPGIATFFRTSRNGLSGASAIQSETRFLWREARQPLVASLYLMLGVLLIILGLAVWLS